MTRCDAGSSRLDVVRHELQFNAFLFYRAQGKQGVSRNLHRYAPQIEAAHRRLSPRFCAFGVRAQGLSGGQLRLVALSAAERMISSGALVLCHLPLA